MCVCVCEGRKETAQTCWSDWKRDLALSQLEQQAWTMISTSVVHIRTVGVENRKERVNVSEL